MYKVSSTVHFAKSVARPTSREADEANWIPNTDVYTTEDGLVIKVELSGMRREDLELSVEGNHLRITGQREDNCRPAKCNYRVMEINYGPFETVIEMPEGYDLGRAKAAYQNGFLRVDVPQAPIVENKTIPVSGPAES